MLVGEKHLDRGDVLLGAILLHPLEVLGDRLVDEELPLLVRVQKQLDRLSIDHHSHVWMSEIIILYILDLNTYLISLIIIIFHIPMVEI